MEWTRDKTLNLINEYRKRRGLWDMTHDDYRKKEMKQKLLVEVASSLGDSIPVVEIEKKFHTLRTQYHREINRMKRKEPYNSKWFGFKTLQFLSSPKACRMGKGRIKSEITEEGTVTKYVIQDMTSCHETSGGSVGCSSNNMNEEFVTIPRKPNRPTTSAVTYDNANETTTAANSRSRELEKLIEETTKDVDEVEEPKPKMSTIKQIGLPLEHHSYSATVSSTGEMSVTEQQSSMHHHQLHHHESHHHHQQQIDEEHVETIDIQTASDDISYQASNSPGGNVSGQHAAVHHQSIPTRIIKIQRRDTCQEEDFYNDEDEQQQQEHPGHHGLHALSTNAGGKHRIYYEANGQQHTATILATPTVASPSASSTLLNSGAIKLQRNTSNGSQQLLQQQQCRDEFSTYGEYVANEMRGIASREILIALKHKINTALFEASMAELQK